MIYSRGDKVIVVGNSLFNHGWKLGEEIELKECQENGSSFYATSDNHTGYICNDDIRPVSPVQKKMLEIIKQYASSDSDEQRLTKDILHMAALIGMEARATLKEMQSHE